MNCMGFLNRRDCIDIPCILMQRNISREICFIRPMLVLILRGPMDIFSKSKHYLDVRVGLDLGRFCARVLTQILTVAYERAFSPKTFFKLSKTFEPFLPFILYRHFAKEFFIQHCQFWISSIQLFFSKDSQRENFRDNRIQIQNIDSPKRYFQIRQILNSNFIGSVGQVFIIVSSYITFKMLVNILYCNRCFIIVNRPCTLQVKMQWQICTLLIRLVQSLLHTAKVKGMYFRPL